ADLHRWAVGKAGEVHDAGLALNDEVVARAAGLRAGLTEAGDGAIHEPRVETAQRFEAEPDPLHRPRTEVFDADGALARELSEDLEALGGLEVERDALLSAVDGHEVRRLAADERRPASRVVALARLLDLDDLGAHVGEHHRAEGTGQHAREIEHADATKRFSARHRILP